MPTPPPKDRPWTEEAARLREAFEEIEAKTGWSQGDLASRAGVAPATVGDMLAGKRAPRRESLVKVCAAMGLNPAWVKIKKEPKYLSPGEAEPSVSPRLVPDLRAVQPHGVERWLSDVRGVSPDERQWLLTVPWPNSHVRYPDMVYGILLTTYRQMRDYKPFEDTMRSSQEPLT